MNPDSASLSMPPTTHSSEPISSGSHRGEMHQRVYAFDWSATSLGPIDGWPPSLRTVVSTVLDCAFPMVVLWGPQLVQIYNDGYRDLIGEKDSSGLGQPAQECWSETRHLNAPIYTRVWQGETVTLKDVRYPITRRDVLEETFFTSCYSPLRNEAGAISGVLVTMFETTAHVRAVAEHEAALQPTRNEHKTTDVARPAVQERLQFALNAAKLGTFVWYPTEDHTELDARMLALFGLPPGSTPSFAVALASLIHPDDRARYEAAVAKALNPAGAGQLQEDLRLILPDGSERWIAITGQTQFVDGPSRQPLHLSGVAVDITGRKRRDAHLAFLVDIDTLFAQHSSADVFMDTIGARMGAYLGVTTCTFVDVDASGDAATVSYAWNRPDVPSTKGTYRLSEYLNEEFGRASRAGEMVVVCDTQTDPRTDGPSYAAFDIAAFVTVPYHRDGRWTNHLGVSDARPRVWRDDELVLIAELANRIFPRLERARTESALRVSEARLRLALDLAELGTWTWNLTTGAGSLDQRSAAIIGLAAGDIADVAEAQRAVIHPGDLAQLEADVKAGIARAGHFTMDYRVIHPDGSLHHVLSQARIFTDEMEQPVQLVGINRDVTAEREAEAALRASETQFRLMADTVPQLVWVTDNQGRVEFLNQRWYEYAGVPSEPITAVDIAARSLHPDDGPKVLAALSEAQRTGCGFEVEQRNRAASGEYRWFLNRAEPYRDPQTGAITKWFGVGIDIEDRKRMEARLEQLYAQEQAARHTAEEASRLRDEFLATVSHELRTPLTSLLGYAQLLQRRTSDAVYVGRTAEKLVQSAKAQAQLIEDLLDISRIVTGKLRMETRPIDLLDVLHAALDTVRPTAEMKGLRIETAFDPTASAIVGDAARLQQVVWNLLSNAIKFTPAGGSIVVQLERDDRDARVRVSDTGQGISPTFLPFVFDRFRQADSSSARAHSGLGLGLAIVRHLVELHGGRVEATSAGIGQGTTFTVRLPLARAEDSIAYSSAPSVGHHVQLDCPPELAGLKVLVVDDQADIRELLQEVLSACGAFVQTCATAHEALTLLHSWRPHVLVSDIAMPGEDGYWLINAIRALPATEGGAVPAIALTAYVQKQNTKKKSKPKKIKKENRIKNLKKG